MPQISGGVIGINLRIDIVFRDVILGIVFAKHIRQQKVLPIEGAVFRCIGGGIAKEYRLGGRYPIGNCTNVLCAPLACQVPTGGEARNGIFIETHAELICVFIYKPHCSRHVVKGFWHNA